MPKPLRPRADGGPPLPAGRQADPLLVVDTSGPGLFASIDGPRPCRAVRRAAKRHDEELWPLVELLLKKASLRLQDLSAVAACRGPGRFTGVRIGLAFASVLGKSLGRPAVGVGALETLAESHAAPGRALVALSTAARDEVYWLVWRGGPVAGPGWCRLADLPAALAGLAGPFSLAGEPAPDAANVLPGSDVVGTRRPSPEELARSARRLLSTLAPESLEATLAPLYLKPAKFEAARA